MAIPLFFVCGGTNFNSQLEEFSNFRFYCPKWYVFHLVYLENGIRLIVINCTSHNNSVILIKKREFFTFCFVPVIPTDWGNEMHCTICNWSQGVNNEYLATLRAQSAGGQPQQPQQAYARQEAPKVAPPPPVQYAQAPAQTYYQQ
ncbi:uncharacterized protein V1518DRAFT_420407 [Limtongia smithiae]|uniref:uncharacterized protein n=1 Tax=Limtongia smithiae TaxID=1125753 RepID=UPI0034CE5D97